MMILSYHIMYICIDKYYVIYIIQSILIKFINMFTNPLTASYIRLPQPIRSELRLRPSSRLSSLPSRSSYQSPLPPLLHRPCLLELAGTCHAFLNIAYTGTPALKYVNHNYECTHYTSIDLHNRCISFRLLQHTIKMYERNSEI